MSGEPAGIAVGPGDGERVRSPIGGDVTFVVTGDQSNGALTVLDVVAPAQAGHRVQPGGQEHQLFPTESDILDPAGHRLVTAYSVLRPDGQWSVMLVNKDQENSHALHIAFRDDSASDEMFLAGPVEIITFGSEQYQWHSNIKGGTADPDGPAARSAIDGGTNTMYTVPKASITVLRGKLATTSRR